MTETVLREERQHIILERLDRSGRVLAVDLAREFDTSEDTIRRDLRELAASGLCRRVYGGALRADERHVGLRIRTSIAEDEKSALAHRCADLVREAVAPGSLLFLDAGSTNLAIALALPIDLDLTVATNAPGIASALLERQGLKIVAMGGRVDQRSGAALGNWTLEQVGDLRPDLAFLGACSVDADSGVGAFDFEEAELKRRVASVSRATATAVTRDKFGHAAPYHVLPISRLDHLIVADAEVLPDATAFEAAGVHVHRSDRRPVGN